MESIFCCINYDTQCVELYQGSKKLGSYASSFSKISNADLRSDPSLYTVEMRIRGNKVRVYSGAAYTLRFTATITAATGYVGFMAEKGVVCDVLRLGGIMNLMSVLILPSRMKSRLLLEDVPGLEFQGIMNLNCSVSILMWRKSAQEARIFLWITTFSIPMKCHWNVAMIIHRWSRTCDRDGYGLHAENTGPHQGLRGRNITGGVLGRNGD